MKQEQIHDALNLLDDDMIEAVEALRDKESFQPNKEQHRKMPWMRYASIVACLCVAALGAFVWIRYEANNSAKNTYDGVANTDGSNKTTEGNTSNDGLADNVPDQDIDGAAPDGTLDGAVDGSISAGEVPSVLVRIDVWQEDGFEGIVAGIVDTDIFAEGTKIQVVFNENISVGVQTENSMKFEKGEPNKTDFPVGSIVRVQFVKFEPATGGSSDVTECEYVIYAELIALADVVDK